MTPAGVLGRSWRGVVVGFDETDRSRCAVRWAGEQAARRGAPLYVVAVLEASTPVTFGWAGALAYADTGQRSRAETQLLAELDACRAELPGLDVHGVLHDGRPSVRLAEYAAQVDADLIAVGCSNRGVLARSLLGSTAAELVRTADRPVVAVRDVTPVQQAAMLTGNAPVVAGVEDIATSGPVLDFAFDAAARSDADLAVVVSGADRTIDAPVMSGHRPVAAAGLDRYLDPWRHRFPGVRASAAAAGDAVARTLLEHSEQARLLVVGAPLGRTVRHLLSAPASRTALHRAACSVAVVGNASAP